MGYAPAVVLYRCGAGGVTPSTPVADEATAGGAAQPEDPEA